MHAAPATNASLVLFRDEIRSLFRDLNDVPWMRGGVTDPPAVDVIETPQAVEIRVDLMAVGPDTLSVELDGDELTIKGSRRIESEEKAGHGRRVQHRSRHFARRCQIPRSLLPDAFEATYRNGLLDIVLFKKSKPRRPSGRG